MLGLEPAFSRGAQTPFPASMGGLPPEPDDPQLSFSRDALPVGLTEPIEQQTIDTAKAELAVPAVPLGALPARHRTSGWTATIAFSCLLHAAAAFALLAAGADRVMIAGSEEAGVLLLGNADADQSAEGDRIDDATQVTLVPMLAPRPVETITAEAVDTVPTEAVSPVEAEALPVEPEISQPTTTASALAQPSERIEPTQESPPEQTAASPAPPILTAEVIQPVEDGAGAPPPVENIAPEPVEGTKAAIVPDVVEPLPEPKPVEKKAVAEKPIRKAERKPAPKTEKVRPAKKEAAKEQPKAEKPARKATKKAGSGGNSSSDAKRGVASGEAGGSRTEAGKGGTRSVAGNAAVSNYPGKVAARLRRASRGISGSARARARSDVRVSFTVTASGGLAGLSIASSSGAPELDKTALAIVRRAAPFPPIPPEAGRSSWAFTLPLGMR
ncbi:MAG: TonB family protein [Mesorhizobium sp.]